MQWKKDGCYTVIGISQMLAFTVKSEIRVRQTDADGEPIFVMRGKRTAQKFNDPIGRNKLVFEGWDIPLKTDMEQKGTFVAYGNACFNFLGSVEEVRKSIDEKNVNEYFSRHDAVLAHGERVLARPGVLIVADQSP